MRRITGNFHKLYRDGLQYNLALFKRYGGVIKVHGTLCVSEPVCHFFGWAKRDGVFQAEQLLVHDPLAIQHILVRDQDAFEEADMFVEYVSS